MDAQQNQMLAEIHGCMGEMRGDMKALRTTVESQNETLHGEQGIVVRLDRCEQQISGFRSMIGWVWTGLVTVGSSIAAVWKNQQ